MYANRGPCEASTSYSHHTQQAASRYLCPQLQRARRRHTGHASSWAGVFPTFFSSPPHQPRPAPSRHPWQRLQSELCSASAGVPANEPLHDPSDRASDRDTQSGTEDDSTLAQSHGKADASGSPAPQTEQEKVGLGAGAAAEPNSTGGSTHASPLTQPDLDSACALPAPAAMADGATRALGYRKDSPGAHSAPRSKHAAPTAAHTPLAPAHSTQRRGADTHRFLPCQRACR